MLEEDSDDEPDPDGRQFDAVTRFEEPEVDEPGPGTLGPSIPEVGAGDGEAPETSACPSDLETNPW